MKYIPQAAPFVMVDEIIFSDETKTSTSFLIKDDNIFVDENGFFLEAGLIENMAQTAAAGTGYKAASENEKPPVGYIGQIKNLEIASLPKVGSVLETTIFNQAQVMNAFIINGEIKVNNTIIVKAEYKIFLQD